jgi:DHA1 family bicyclomycin/chloramphenicol resistance-like MFS transporter
MLIVLRFFQALGGCAGMVISRAIVRDRFSPQETAHVFSMLLLVMSLAPVVAPMIGSTILLVANWRAIFGLLVVFGTAVGIATLLRLTESRSRAAALESRQESMFRSYWAVLRERRVMGYALAGGCSHVGLLTYLAISPSVIITDFHLSPQFFSAAIGINGIGLVSANYLNRRLLARLGYDYILRRANLASLAASAVLLVDALSGFGGVFGVTVPLFFMVGAIGFTQPNAFAGALALDPQRAGATSALVGFLQFGLGAVGASVAGALNDGTARPMAAVILAAYVLASLALRILARP